MKFILSVLLGVISMVCISQNMYRADEIPTELKENANSVIRKETTAIEIATPKKLVLRNKLVITILNKNGNRHINPTVPYDNASKVKSAEARIYDAEGEEIEKFKKKDFLDISAVSGGTLYSDNRMLVFSYTPDDYPYTIVFEYETETGNTALIPPFIPLARYNSSVMESIYSITYGEGIKMRQKITDPSNEIIKTEQPGSIFLSSKGIEAIEPEYHSPSLDSKIPSAFFALDAFYLQGVPGGGKDWAEFGTWMDTKLLQDVRDLPAATKTKIKNLVANATTVEEKARIVYEYVQKNTRYISVQIGIGGWKPMAASEVDKLGYGDCKALTNYTKSLLDEVGVTSYYSIVYGDRQKRNIESDFTSLQGNHMILAVPNDDETIWLECTSQTVPFGFIANFTDDRDVLMVTPEGGKIAHTTVYPYHENTLKTTGKCVLHDSGNISVKVNMESGGTQYSQRHEIESKTKDEKDEHYKEYWDYVDNITLKSVAFDNNKEAVKLSETIEFDARSYTSTAGENLIFPVNVLNRFTYIPKRYKNRKFPLYISRGFVDEDEVSIELPPGFGVTSLPEPIQLETKFGMYTSQLTETEPGKYKYQRKFEIHEGEFPKEEYENYRKFMKKVARHDNQKIILTKL
ncbi:DUF3857 domain-containing protein [Aureisphaera galaxeae]|uniref:DUF3857 domain-containing protein n=1 Tax=Aureisphaera galaxeae TaxID=1538023 RepID=UPI0023504567|nr:DUF3857 domain-containing protein [Aureisphaera galaxeae]MDC8003172.1 DUF3857 domain-containing protein [Aureisphaera galaxeae]